LKWAFPKDDKDEEAYMGPRLDQKNHGRMQHDSVHATSGREEPGAMGILAVYKTGKFG